MNDRQPQTPHTWSKRNCPAWSECSVGSANIIVDLEEQLRRRDEEMEAMDAQIAQLQQAMWATWLLLAEGDVVGRVAEEIAESPLMPKD